MKNNPFVKYTLPLLLFMVVACEQSETIVPDIQDATTVSIEDNVRLEYIHNQEPQDAVEEAGIAASDLATFNDGGGVEAHSSTLCTIDISKEIDNTVIREQLVRSNVP